VDMVFIVYHSVIGDSGSIFVYAICSTEQKAKVALRKAGAFKKGTQYFTADPECTPYALQLHILKIAVNRLYSLGVLSQVNRRNLEKLEVIS